MQFRRTIVLVLLLTVVLLIVSTNKGQKTRYLTLYFRPVAGPLKHVTPLRSVRFGSSFIKFSRTYDTRWNYHRCAETPEFLWP